MPSEKELRLDTVAGGAAPELFDAELAKVLRNIHDPNTKADAERSVTMTITLKPDEDRHELAITCSVKSKLVPHKAATGTAYSGKHADGRVVAVTYDPKQHELWAEDEDADVTPIDREQEGTSGE